MEGFRALPALFLAGTTKEEEGKAGEVKGEGFPVGPREKRTEKCRGIFRSPVRWGTGAPAEWRLASNALLFIEEEEEDLGSQEARANLSGILVAVGVAISAKKMWQAGLTVRLLVVLEHQQGLDEKSESSVTRGIVE